MKRIHFDRVAGTATYPGFDGWGGEFSGFGSDPYFEVVRAMVDAGEPDGPATFIDETGMACMTVRSIHSCVRRYRPNDQEKADRKTRLEAKRAAEGRDAS